MSSKYKNSLSLRIKKKFGFLRPIIVDCCSRLRDILIAARRKQKKGETETSRKHMERNKKRVWQLWAHHCLELANYMPVIEWINEKVERFFWAVASEDMVHGYLLHAYG